MITLGIETSCDETAAAVVEKGKVLSSEVSSSVHLHSPYGGVIPEIASRFHSEYIFQVTDKALKDAQKKIEDVDLIAVTQGPGLPGSLLVGMAFAKAISYASETDLIGVDHVQAHILSSFLGEENEADPVDAFPFLGMVVSGGHTSIYLCRRVIDIELIGRTKDDAVGEAFDKVSKILGLGYPGGPIVEKRALKYKGQDRIKFPRALLKDDNDLDFSFSGIKTAVLYRWRDSGKTESCKDEICFSFQEAVIDVIIRKLKRASALTGIKRLAVGGGVIHNNMLRRRVLELAEEEDIDVFLPKPIFCTDNAAMIALLGEKLYAAGRRGDLLMNAEPSGVTIEGGR